VTRLRAGPLSATFDAGSLRWIRLGDREALRGIYAALRDPSWLTLPARIEGLRLHPGAEAFSASFTAHYEAGAIRFSAETRIDGTPDGTIRYVFDGRALADFEKNRIGVCVLHPADGCAGEPCQIEHGDGRITFSSFPRQVAPHQPFLDVRRIRHAVAPGRLLEVELQGEWFETEDQRNWSDSSFKTYATAVGLPLPARIHAGDRIRHEVVVRLIDGPLPALEPAARPAEPSSAPPPDGPLRAGFLLGPAPPSARELERARMARADHLRVDLHLGRGGWETSLALAAQAARACGVPLVVAAFAGDPAEAALRALADQAARLGAPVEATFCFREATGRSDPALLAVARRVEGLGAAVGGGAAGPFAEVNRYRHAAEAADLVAFELCPQVHARDEGTIHENVTSLGDVARTARLLAGPAALWLAPVRFALAAQSPDARLAGPLGGEWVRRLLPEAARAGFHALTFAQAFGEGGLLAADPVTPAEQALRERTA
jgi:hypothetical protein